jgi:hypothetical protein
MPVDGAKIGDVFLSDLAIDTLIFNESDQKPVRDKVAFNPPTAARPERHPVKLRWLAPARRQHQKRLQAI